MNINKVRNGLKELEKPENKDLKDVVDFLLEACPMDYDLDVSKPCVKTTCLECWKTATSKGAVK